MNTRTTRDRISRALRTALIITAATALVVPVAAWASHVFDDVDNDAFYASAVSWAKTNGITNGCNPSQGNTRYCPDDEVTRGTMAIFLRNLADSGTVDAGTLDGLDSSAFLRTTGTAANADKLDGLDAVDLAPKMAMSTTSLMDGITRLVLTGTYGSMSLNTALLETTLVAPADGYVQIQWTGYVRPDGGGSVGFFVTPAGGSCDEGFRVRGTSAGDRDPTAVDPWVTLPSGQGLEQVTAGTHTFRLCISALDSGAEPMETVDILAASLSAVWYPTAAVD